MAAFAAILAAMAASNVAAAAASVAASSARLAASTGKNKESRQGTEPQTITQTVSPKMHGTYQKMKD